MPIKSLKKLPDRAQKMWEQVYKAAKSKGSTDAKAAKVAWTVVQREYKEARTKKSVSVAQAIGNVTDSFIDVVLGYPMIDAHKQFLSENFWSKRPIGVLKGDMEHYYADRAEGLYIDDSEDYEGWIPVAQKFWHEGDKLMARVELPENHKYTDTFLNGWGSGDFGVSIEYIAPEDAFEYKWIGNQLVEVVREGTITGFTFTKNPAIDTKPKQNE